MFIFTIFNIDGEKLELLHDNAGFHMRLKELRERRKNLFGNGPYSRPMLARQEIAIRWVCKIIDAICNCKNALNIAKYIVNIFLNSSNFIIRRELCGLPDEDFCEVPLRPNTDMDLWHKAVQLLNGKDANIKSSGLVELKDSSNAAEVHG